MQPPPSPGDPPSILIPCSLLLRVQLHYELALCELSADFVVKAAEQLASGLKLDYGRYDKETDEVLTGKGHPCLCWGGGVVTPCSMLVLGGSHNTRARRHRQEAYIIRLKPALV
jgi:hypothetical protein